MKKRFLLSLMTLVLFLPCMAQRYYDGHTINPQWNNSISSGSKITVVFDYSQTLFKGFAFDDLCGIDKGFSDDIKESEARFIFKFNDLLRKKRKNSIIYCRSLDDADYILTIIPDDISDKGNYKGKAILKDKEDNVVAAFTRISCNGGKVGSFTNLIGDGYENLAAILAATIEDGISKRKN